MYSIDDFRKLNRPENILLSRHSLKRLRERGISLRDIIFSVENGEIIEYYDNDYPFPSCLILGRSGQKPLHIVASIGDGMIHLISAYIPDPDKWEEDLKTRKGTQS